MLATFVTEDGQVLVIGFGDADIIALVHEVVHPDVDAFDGDIGPHDLGGDQGEHRQQHDRPNHGE